MEEKVIIQGERYKINIRAILIGISIGLIVLGLLVYVAGDGYSSYWDEWWSIGNVMFDPFSFTSGLLMDFGIILLPVVLIICWWLSSVELTVTDKRVFVMGELCLKPVPDILIRACTGLGQTLYCFKDFQKLLSIVIRLDMGFHICIG